MTIVRNSSDASRVKIPKDFLDNPKLSYQAKGVLAFLLATKADDFKMVDLIKKSNQGRVAVRSIVCELIKNGYILPERLRNSEGQFEGLRYHIYPYGRDLL